MMPPSYHYRQAESYLQGAAELRRQGLDDKARMLLTIAQVHATLATAAGWWDDDEITARTGQQTDGATDRPAL